MLETVERIETFSYGNDYEDQPPIPDGQPQRTSFHMRRGYILTTKLSILLVVKNGELWICIKITSNNWNLAVFVKRQDQVY